MTKNCDIPNMFGISQFVELLEKYEILLLDSNKTNLKFAIDKFTYNGDDIDKRLSNINTIIN